MLSLLDPHTNFLRPDAFAQMRERQQGSFHGIGVIISMRGGKITVITPIEGTPAARLGLRAGDVIESVDGDADRGHGPRRRRAAAARARGLHGHDHHLPARPRRAARPHDRARPRAHRLGPLRLHARRATPPTSASPTSPARPATRSTGPSSGCRSEGATRLLLDLRDNPGGIVDSAVAVAGCCSSRASRSSPPRAAPPTPSRTTAPRATACTSRGRWSCWSTAARPRRPRSSPARSRTTTAAWSSARSPSARASCRRSTRCATPASR